MKQKKIFMTLCMLLALFVLMLVVACGNNKQIDGAIDGEQNQTQEEPKKKQENQS